MTFQLHFFNFWPILVSVITNMIIGALWYSPVLFGNIWMNLVGMTEADITKEEGNKAMALGFVPAIVRDIFLYFILAFCNSTTLIDALVLGLILSIGFSGMTLFNNVIFEGRSSKLFLLNAGYNFASLMVASLIITLWK